MRSRCGASACQCVFVHVCTCAVPVPVCAKLGSVTVLQMTGWSPCDEILTCAWDRIQRITIGLKWVAASDNLPIRIFVLWESSLRSNYIISLLGSRPNLGKVEKQKSGAGAQRLFFLRLRQSISNRARHVRLSCLRQYTSIDHHHHHHHHHHHRLLYGLCSAGRMNESNEPVYNRCDRKSMLI